MADYRALLDTEVWAFLDKTERYYPSDAVDLTVAQQRVVYNKMSDGRPLTTAAHQTSQQMMSRLVAFLAEYTFPQIPH